MFKMLVIAPSWIGDAVCAQPLFARLHERHPGLLLDVVAVPWVAPVFRRMREVRSVILSPFRHGSFAWAERRRMGHDLSIYQYDEALVLPNSWKSALPVWFAGIPQRTGFSGEMRMLLLNNRHRLNKRRTPLLVQRYAQLAEIPGQPVHEPIAPLALMRSADSEQATRAALRIADGSVVFCPGAEYGPAKRWPEEHFAALAQMLGSESQPVLLLGSAKDKDVGERIAARSAGRARNLCGLTHLDQAIDIIAMSSVVITNDSGLMHVAAGLHKPTIALFGSSSPRYTPPLSPKARVLWLELDCSPCFKRECPKKHFNCMRQLTPAQVLEAVAALPAPAALQPV